MAKSLIVAFLFAFFSSFLLGKVVIPYLKKLKAGQSILEYLSEHFCKSGTPTMGGIFFVLASSVSFFIFKQGSQKIAILAVAIFLAYAVVGFLDDYIKIKFCQNQGLSPKQKIAFQIVIAIIASLFAFRMGLTQMFLPFTKQLIDVGFWIIPLGVFVFLATTNCVNLTDGLDGLNGSVCSYMFLFCAVLVLLQMTSLNVFVEQQEFFNLCVLCVAISGALFGFLLFNTYKASVFMGDTGSLALGGVFAGVMIFSGNILYIPILGIMHVVSGISVIIQVGYYKRTGKRFFLIAPYHHNLQHKGFAESKIVFWYSAVTVVCGLISLLAYL